MSFQIKRAFVFERGSIDVENRTVEAALTSETPGRQFYPGIGVVNEVLRHTPESIDMTRAKDGLTLLFNHDTNRPIGGVTNIRLDPDNVLRGTLSFDDDDESNTMFKKVRRGSLKGISASYDVLEFEEPTPGELIATKWQPMEISVLPMAMDPTVGINRGTEDKTMSDETTPAESVSPAEEVSLDNISSIQDRNIQKGIERGIKLERKRQSQIDDAFRPYLSRGTAYVDLLQTCKDNSDVTLERAQTELLKLLGTGGTGEMPEAIQTANRSAVPNGQDSSEKFRDGVLLALSRAVGILTPEEKKAGLAGNEFVGMSISDIAIECARQRGWNVRGMTRQEILGKMMMSRFIDPGGPANHDVTSFPAILEDLLNKGVGAGWQQNEETWSRWCETGTAQDFKTISQVKLANVPQLQEVPKPADGPIAEVLVSDATEQGNLATFAGRLSLTRQALINDDLSMFSTMAVNMGRAAARRVGDEAYAAITSNPTLTETAGSLFVAGNNNIGTGAISEDTVDAMNVAMGLQQDPSNVTLNYRMRYLIVPLSMELKATKQVGIERILDPSGAGAAETNPLAGRYSVVADPRIDIANTAAAPAIYWYGAAAMDTVKVFFLNGREGPTVEQDEGWSYLASHWRVYIDVTAFPIDFRTLTRWDAQ